MIKNIIYVEDGSVDVEELKEKLDFDTEIIVYRQGSTPPVLVQPTTPLRKKNDKVQELIDYAKDVRAEARDKIVLSRNTVLYDAMKRFINFTDDIIKLFGDE